MSENKFMERLKGRGKNILIGVAVIAMMLIVAVIAMGRLSGETAVEFNVLSDADIPQDIVSQVIPEYRGLERALACKVGDKVYVLVSRGEKPTSGFDVNIDKMLIEEKDGSVNLAVYANFADPQPDVALTQILTYPLKIAETELTDLPDQIELRVQYK